eukprot:m51a1_g2427 hypothetical protein (521) ;mRNA; f:829387-831854
MAPGQGADELERERATRVAKKHQKGPGGADGPPDEFAEAEAELERQKKEGEEKARREAEERKRKEEEERKRREEEERKRKEEEERKRLEEEERKRREEEEAEKKRKEEEEAERKRLEEEERRRKEAEAAEAERLRKEKEAAEAEAAAAAEKASSEAQNVIKCAKDRTLFQELQSSCTDCQSLLRSLMAERRLIGSHDHSAESTGAEIAQDQAGKTAGPGTGADANAQAPGAEAGQTDKEADKGADASQAAKVSDTGGPIDQASKGADNGATASQAGKGADGAEDMASPVNRRSPISYLIEASQWSQGLVRGRSFKRRYATEQSAASNIQRVFRGHVGREEAKRVRSEVDKEAHEALINAACEVQAVLRIGAARSTEKKMNSAIEQMQGLFSTARLAGPNSDHKSADRKAFLERPTKDIAGERAKHFKKKRKIKKSTSFKFDVSPRPVPSRPKFKVKTIFVDPMSPYAQKLELRPSPRSPRYNKNWDYHAKVDKLEEKEEAMRSAIDELSAAWDSGYLRIC